jgi:hypothetical protein
MNPKNLRGKGEGEKWGEKYRFIFFHSFPAFLLSPVSFRLYASFFTFAFFMVKPNPSNR